MDIIKKIFRFKTKLRIKDLTLEGLKEYKKNIFMELSLSKLDVVIVRKVLSTEAIEKIKLGIREIKLELFDKPHKGARTFPKSCSSGQNDSATLEKFFLESTKNNNLINKYSNIGISIIFEDLMFYLNGKQKVKLAKNKKYPYLVGTFRFINAEPQKVGLTQAHTGYDYAKKNSKYSYLPIKNKINTLKQLSVFVVINKPNEGGEFTVFNFDRQEFEIMVDDVIESKKGKKYNLYGNKKSWKTFQLEVGDLITFSDYKLWHKVEKVIGENERVTYGCWGAFDFENNNFYYWS